MALWEEDRSNIAIAIVGHFIKRGNGEANQKPRGIKEEGGRRASRGSWVLKREKQAIREGGVCVDAEAQTLARW